MISYRLNKEYGLSAQYYLLGLTGDSSAGFTWTSEEQNDGTWLSGWLDQNKRPREATAELVITDSRATESILGKLEWEREEDDFAVLETSDVTIIEPTKGAGGESDTSFVQSIFAFVSGDR